MTKLSTRLGAALLAAGLAGAAAAEVYRWVDDGMVHYGDHPPKGVEAQRVNPERRGFDTLPAPRQDTAAAGDEAQAAGATANDPERTARIRQEQCDKARERLENYRNAARMRIQEGDETREMTAEERVQAIARAEADVAEFCGEETDG